MHDKKMVGLYVHQHWPYNYPYCARTWQLPDWRGYASGLRALGYNTILIWPMLETMPDPLTPSDQQAIERTRQVIAMLQQELGMRVYLCLCPNIVADSAAASQATFEKRHYYYCDVPVDPGDPAALRRLIDWRETLLAPLAGADGFSIIDSDPGGYEGSTNAEFVNLLVAHRRLFDRLRPGIELIYWMHAGWRGWSRFYETGRLELGTAEELDDTLAQVIAANPEPWGLANGWELAKNRGVEARVIGFNYGRIEGEPSFPKTNFGGTGAWEGGAGGTPRGVMGNAQTHCVQLPNTFAFARGAHGQPIEDADYVAFAEELIPGQGATIVGAWKALNGDDAAAMRASEAALSAIAAPAAGALSGLLFDNPTRFRDDLVKMLRLQAARQDFIAAPDRTTLRPVFEAASTWQATHGYENNWYDPGLHQALRALGDPDLDAAVAVWYEAREPFDPGIATPGAQVAANFRKIETYTPRLLQAMGSAAHIG